MNDWLGCGQSKLADTLKVYMLASDPQVVEVLHGEPALGRSSHRLGKAKRHFRCNPAAAPENATQSRSSHIQLFRELAAADAIGLKVDLGNELTGMRGVVHSH